MRIDEMFSESWEKDPQREMFSPAFKTWFGDSKVVDANGNPLMVYHGTPNTFSSFDPSRTGDIGIHFGNAKQASTAASDIYGKPKEGANLIPVYLRIVKPLYVRDMFSTMRNTWIIRAKHYYLEVNLRFNDEEREHLYDLAKKLDKLRRKAGGSYSMTLLPSNDTIRPVYKDLEKQFWKHIETVAKRNGFDGMIYENKSEGKGLSYIVFNPNQIKSVFNKGTWSDNEDISESVKYSTVEAIITRGERRRLADRRMD